MFSPNLPPLKWSIESNLTVDNGYDSWTWCGKEEKQEGKVCRRQRIFDSGQSFNFIVFDLGKPELRRVTVLSWDCHSKSAPTSSLNWRFAVMYSVREASSKRDGLANGNFDGFKYCFLIPGHRWFWGRRQRKYCFHFQKFGRQQLSGGGGDFERGYEQMESRDRFWWMFLVCMEVFGIDFSAYGAIQVFKLALWMFLWRKM